MTKIVINACFGGFSLSKEARTNFPDFEHYWDIPRDHPLLVEIVEQDSEAASGAFARLRVVEIPDDVEWQIEEYDGYEHIAEKHRTWDEFGESK
jgi:hypothetical protein